MKSKTSRSSKPAILWLASEPRPLEVSGHYDEKSQTWSNRKYELAAAKKHNEDM